MWPPNPSPHVMGSQPHARPPPSPALGSACPLQMWQAGKEEWKLLRVAVVELRNDVFVARLFFGERGRVAVFWAAGAA